MSANLTIEEIEAYLDSIVAEEDYDKSPNKKPAKRELFQRNDGVYRWKDTPLEGYKEKYKTPVIKRDDVFYNLSVRRAPKSNSVEVYSIEQYRKRKR